MRTDYETLLIERHEQHVLVVTLNRPERSNAFNTQMGLDLRDAFVSFYVDQEDVRPDPPVIRENGCPRGRAGACPVRVVGKAATERKKNRRSSLRK